METLISAVLGDIVSRAISIMVEKCREQTTAEEDLQRLQQLLLRISAVVEEAGARCVTNRGMIRQVSMMIIQMFRGYYLLDSFKSTQKKTNDEECMFGRQMEREEAISFLLQDEPLGGGNLGVLPIVGPELIGKSTLVEHVCDDERVRKHFPLILRYIGSDLKDETAITFRDHCLIKHQNIASTEERALVVIELLGDVDEGAWKRLLQTSERCMARGSKIIITSRSEKIVSVGTTEAIKLSCLSKEAYWYFFKMLVFGSTDPEEHPKLTSIAMELALEMCGSFIFAYVAATLLRENPSARFWCRVLRQAREYTKKNNLVFGEYHEDRMSRYAWSTAETLRGSENHELFLIHHSHQNGPASRGEVPRITAVELVSGTWSAMPRGKFEVLSWRSLIPPYYNYVYSWEFVQNKNTKT
ncbi:hypothetical protein ACQ4PT_059370 [Festuca glaucescens]